MPGKDPYNGTDSMSPSSTAVAPTKTVFPASIARGTRPSSTSTYETNANEVGEIEKSMGTSWSSVRTRRGSMMLATRTPSIVQKLRQWRVRPSDAGSLLTTALSVRRAKRRSGLLTATAPSVPLERWKKVGRASG